MKKFIVFILALLVLISFINKEDKDYYVIPDEAIRFRILANSNSIEDQYVKQIVKTNIEKEFNKSLSITNTIDETRTNINKSIPIYKDIINDTFKDLNYNQSFDVKFGYNYFPEKEYQGIIYNEGKYESLLVTIGEGKGDNWWCVLFPPLCLLEAEKTNNNDVEYRFFIKDIVDKYLLNKS